MPLFGDLVIPCKCIYYNSVSWPFIELLATFGIPNLLDGCVSCYFLSYIDDSGSSEFLVCFAELAFT